VVIDFHTHNFPDALASRAVESMLARLEGRLLPVGDGTAATQLMDMARFRVDRAVVCPVATKPAQFRHILDRAKAVAAGGEGKEPARRFVQLASLHPADPDVSAHAREIADAGVRGVKLHPYCQGFRLDDPGVFPFFAVLRDAGLFAMAHCGGDPGFPNAPMCCGPNEVAVLLKAVPGLVFVAAHLGGVNGNPPHATDVLLPFENCFIDTAVLTPDETNPEARRVAAEWPADRMLFGSDYFWRDAAHVADWLRECRPDAADQEKIFHANAERLLGL